LPKSTKRLSFRAHFFLTSQCYSRQDRPLLPPFLLSIAFFLPPYPTVVKPPSSRGWFFSSRFFSSQPPHPNPRPSEVFPLRGENRRFFCLPRGPPAALTRPLDVFLSSEPGARLHRSRIRCHLPQFFPTPGFPLFFFPFFPPYSTANGPRFEQGALVAAFFMLLFAHRACSPLFFSFFLLVVIGTHRK